MALILVQAGAPIVLNPEAILVLLIVSSVVLWFVVTDGGLFAYGMIAFGVAIVCMFVLWLLSQDVIAWTNSLRFYMLVCVVMWLPTMFLTLRSLFSNGNTSNGYLKSVVIVASIIGTVCCVLCIKWIIAPW